MSLLEVNDINVYYGAIHAVRNVSLEVHAGEIVSIIGANGAGKSTLIKALTGVYPKDSGQIQIAQSGKEANIKSPQVAHNLAISKVYQAHIPTFAAGYWLFGFASKKYHPIDDLDAAAWKALNMRTRYYTSRLHVGAFYLPAFLEEMLREVEEH